MLPSIPEMDTAKIQVDLPPTASHTLSPLQATPPSSGGGGIPTLRTEQFRRVANRTSNDADAQKLVSILREWDADGDGKFSIEEVMNAAKQMSAERQQSSSLRKWLIGLGVLYLVSLAIMLALMIAAGELIKDAKPNGQGVLVDTRAGDVIKVKSKVDSFSPFDYLDHPLNQIEQLGVIYLSGLPSGEAGSEDLVERLYSISRVSRNMNDRSVQMMLSDGSILDVDSVRAVLYEPILSEQEANSCGKEWLLATGRHCAIAIIWNGEERADPIAAEKAASNVTDPHTGVRRLGLPRVSIVGPQYATGPRGIGRNINFNTGRVYGNEGVVSLGRNRFFQQGQLRACRGMACAF